jgi:hypothetical protein
MTQSVLISERDTVMSSEIHDIIVPLVPLGPINLISNYANYTKLPLPLLNSHAPNPAVTYVNKSWFIVIPRTLTSDLLYRFRPQLSMQISLIMQMW